MTLPTRVARSSGTIDPFDALHRDFDGVLGRLFGGDAGAASRWSPYAVDVREDADHLYVDAELPGFKKDEIDITLENQTLTISAERKEETKDAKKGEYLLNERRYRRFIRSFTLPPNIDEKQVDAKLVEGVLHLTLNRREESKPKKIQVG